MQFITSMSKIPLHKETDQIFVQLILERLNQII